MRYIVNIIFLLYVLPQLSCNSQKTISGKWNIYDKKIESAPDYIKMDNKGNFEIKHYAYLYSFTYSYSFSSMEEFKKKSIIKLKYKIDSIDTNNGYHITIFKDSFKQRQYVLIDEPYMIFCGVKPKPFDKSYMYNPLLYINKKSGKKPGDNDYKNYNFIIADSIKFGEIALHFTNSKIKSDIKDKDKNLNIDRLGVHKINDCFDVRYMVFDKYKAYIKANNKLMEIPFIYHVFWDYKTINLKELNAKKEYIKTFCPNDSSRCLIFGGLNDRRDYFLEKFNTKVEGGNVILLLYLSRKKLFEIYDSIYYGTNN